MKPLPRTNVAIAIVLAMLTGLVIGQLGLIGMARPHAIPAPGSASLQTGQAYLAALDRLLETGEPEQLHALLGDDFIDHGATDADRATKAGLVASLTSLHNTFPALSVRATALTATGDFLTVDLVYDGDEIGTFTGMNIRTAYPFAGREILRVRRGHIVERWGDPIVSNRFETLASATVAPQASLTTSELFLRNYQPDSGNHRLTPELRRWTFEPHAVVRSDDPQELLMIVEAGSVQIQFEPPQAGALAASADAIPAIQWSTASGALEDQPIWSGSPKALQIGDVTTLATTTGYRMWNPSDRPAHLLVLSMSSTSSQPGPSFIANGVARNLVARGVSLSPGAGDVTVALGRAELSPGSTFTQHVPPGGAEVVAIELGAVQTETLDGLIWSVDHAANISVTRDALSLDAGAAASVDDATEITYRAVGTEPAVLWLMTFTPQQHPSSIPPAPLPSSI